MFAILCPLKIELKLLKPYFENEDVILSYGGHGKVSFAVRATQLLVENPKVKTLICVGAAGAINQDLKIGDVIIGLKSIEHDYKERFVENTLLPMGELDGSFLQKAKEIQKKLAYLHLGVIASGDEDIISEDRAKEIFQLTEASAVAWEGIGGYKACNILGKNFIEVRGITDHCGGTAAFDFKQNLNLAMKNAASIIKELIL